MKIAEYQQMMDYLTGPREGFKNGKLVMGPNKGMYPLQLRDRENPGKVITKYFKTKKELKDFKKEYDAQGPGQGGKGIRKGGEKARIPFTKKQQEIAEAFAKKKGISVDDLTPSQRKDVRDGMYTLESLKETKREKNLKAGRVRKINILNKFKPIDPDTGKVFTEKKWLSTPDHQRFKAVALAKDPVEYKERLKRINRKNYLANRDEIIKKQQDYYYEGGGKEKQAKRRDFEYKEGPLKGKGGILQADNNRLLKYMSVAAEYENPKFEIYEENGKFAGVRDTDKNIIYRDHRYKGNKGVPITAHPDYENTMDFARIAKKFKYDRPDKLLGSYFSKYERAPTYAEMYNFFQRDPRASAKTKVQNPLELHHMATMEKYPTKSYQLALFDKNTGANKIINDYNTPGSDAFKNKAIADKRLKELNIRLKIGGEFLGGGAKTAEGALAAAKTKTTGMFKKQVAENPQLVDEMAKYLGILGCGSSRLPSQTGGNPTQECIARGAEKINNPKLIKPGAEARNAAQFLNRAAKIGRNVMKFGVIPEAIFVAGESLVRIGMGDTLSESLLRASDYLLPGNQTKMADQKKFERTVGPENALTIMRARDYKNAIQELADVEVNADIDIQQNMEDFTGISDQQLREIKEQRIKQATQNVKNKFVPEAVTDSASRLEMEAQDIAGTNNIFKKIGVAARNAKVDEIETLAAPGQQKKEIAPPMLTNKDLADVFITDEFLQKERDELGGAPELTKENVLNFYRGMKPEELQGQDNILNQAYFQTVFNDARRNSANQERFFGTQGLPFGEPVTGGVNIPTNRFADFKLGMYAGGGIAKLAGKSSGPAPEKGPTSQGLAFFKNNGRKL